MGAFGIVARALPEQDAERVARLLQAGAELRDGGARAVELRCRLGRIQLGGRAVLETGFRDCERFLLDLGVLLSLIDQHLERSE